MARPEKNTVDYFPFICAEGKKMYYLEEAYGNDGFATFVKILRELANTEFHYLELSRPRNKMFLAAKCKIDINLLEDIINDLVDLGKFNKELWNDFNVIWCQDFIDSIQDAYRKRSNKCVGRKDILTMFTQGEVGTNGVNSAINPLNSNVKPQTILDYTIEKKKRESRAINFLKSEFPQRFETDFLMKYKSKIQNPKKFAQDFNDTVDQESLEFTDRILFGRLGKYARNWIENQNKYSKTPAPDSYESGKLTRF